MQTKCESARKLALKKIRLYGIFVAQFRYKSLWFFTESCKSAVFRAGGAESESKELHVKTAFGPEARGWG